MKRLILSLLISVGTMVLVFSFSQRVYGYSVVNANAEIIVNGEKIQPEKEPLLIDGRLLAPAGSVFKNLGAVIGWDPETREVSMLKDNIEISMKVGTDIARIGGREYLSDTPTLLIRDTVMVPVRFVSQAFGANVRWDYENRVAFIEETPPEPLPEPEPLPQEVKQISGTVVIDAGHGGKQLGAVHGGVEEKNLNLDVVLKLDALLRYHGINTYMTREDDRDIGLYDRSGLANEAGADLFVSVHHNAGSSGEKGSMTLYCPSSKSGFTGKDLAGIVQREIIEKLGTKDMGTIPRPNLAVLRTTKMPSIIAEIGYMTNKDELQRLKSGEFQQDAAEALASAVIKALEMIKG